MIPRISTCLKDQHHQPRVSRTSSITSYVLTNFRQFPYRVLPSIQADTSFQGQGLPESQCPGHFVMHIHLYPCFYLISKLTVTGSTSRRVLPDYDTRQPTEERAPFIIPNFRSYELLPETLLPFPEHNSVRSGGNRTALPNSSPVSHSASITTDLEFDTKAGPSPRELVFVQHYLLFSMCGHGCRITIIGKPTESLP